MKLLQFRVHYIFFAFALLLMTACNSATKPIVTADDMSSSVYAPVRFMNILRNDISSKPDFFNVSFGNAALTNDISDSTELAVHSASHEPMLQGTMTIPGDPDAIVIPETAFINALENEPYYRVDEQTQDRAAKLAATANDPTIIGVMADLHINAQPQTFRGTLFIVVRDFDPTADNQVIQSTDYFVAVVELSGETPWFATASRFIAQPLAISVMSFGQRCCGQPTVCVSPPSESPCPPFGRCPSREVGISNREPGDWPTFSQRMEMGRPLIDLRSYSTKDMTGTGPISPPKELFCTEVRDKFCESVIAICGPDDVGFTRGNDGKPEIPTGSADSGGACSPGGGSRSVTGCNTPAFCQRAMSWEGLPAECQGCCEFCGGRWPTLGGIIRPGLGETIDPFSPACALVQCTADSNNSCCSQRSPALDQQIMQLEVCGGLSNPAECTGQICQQTGRRSVQECTTCVNGECHKSAQVPKVNPEIAAGGETTVSSKKDKPIIERNFDFEPSLIVGERSEPKPPPKDPPAESAKTAKVTSNLRKKSSIPTVDPKNTLPFFTPKDKGEPDNRPSAAGDPVLLADGSFDIAQTDLSYSGPMRSLEFHRTYNSSSDGRSALGSNWSHNWDVRIVALTAETAPVWALPYCGGDITTTSCLLLNNGSASQQLYYLDVGSFLYMPQAGSTDTIAPASNGGWALRSANGHIQLFNAEGYLVSDRDRFGNGFTIEYETTPLSDLYQHYCPFSFRRCSILSYFLGVGIKPDASDEAWRNLIPSEDFILPSLSPTPANVALRERLSYARDYFFYLLSLGTDVQPADGFRRLRPRRVTDDLGRTLEFYYYQANKLPSPPLTPDSPSYDFAKTLKAGLLTEVRGPAGTVVRFTYDRPVNYPSALNEFFLTHVERQDSPTSVDLVAAPARTIEFHYQWPESQLLSYNAENYITQVYDKYLAYYQSFVGCMFQNVICPGEYGMPKTAEGKPSLLALAEQNAYIAALADNIVLVKSLGIIESETRYDVDPMSPVFDHVLAQRYGSSVAHQEAPITAPDLATDQWQTSLPKATFAYANAGPISGTITADLTDPFLPSQLRQRYPLETLQTSLISITAEAAIGFSSGTTPSCDYKAMEQARQALPGFQPTLQYTDSLANEAQPNLTLPLLRSRLTCDQLAIAQLADPTHNDLVSTLVVSATFVSGSVISKTVPVQVVGQRAQVAANLNRICGWTQITDRDGFAHFYGLNYRGQILVDAQPERNSADFIFSEQLYNADGLVVQERRPTRGLQPWQPIAGYTAYTYDEIDPAGNRGWNAWLPGYWSRRMNLVRAEEHAAGGSVLNALEDVTTGFINAVGRYQRFGYEPLFNQLKFMEQGSLELRAQPQGGPQPVGPLPITPTATLSPSLSTVTPLVLIDIPHTRLDYIFDYQELLTDTSAISATLAPVLDAFTVWGASWLTKTSALGQSEYDYDLINSWQLPLHFYGADLNGDGSYGFGPSIPITGVQSYRRASGVPVIALLWPATSAAISQTTQLIWAPNGQPSVVRRPDGATMIFEYYRIGGEGVTIEEQYGYERPPADKEVSSQYRGLLARIHTQRFGTNYRSDYGPPSAPCHALAGPYQWLLPATCSANPEVELLALGLTPQTAKAILASVQPGSPDHWLTTAYSYSELGEVRHEWGETGATHIVRDTDGRPIAVTDPLSVTTTMIYTQRGYPERLVRTEAQGNVLEDHYQRFDEEGHVLYECAAWTAGGCPDPASGLPISGTVQTYTYWPEGGLQSTTDPEGLMTEYVYNERQLPISQRSYHPQHTDVAPRLVMYSYNVDSDLTQVVYGASDQSSPSTAILTESLAYDGLRRMTTYTDTRQYPWHYAYSDRDLLIRSRRSDEAYPITPTVQSSWEAILNYDLLGQLVARYDNGILTAHYTRTNAGLIASQTAQGYGTSYTTYDLLGQPVWSRDAAGNQSLSTWRARPHVATTDLIRTNGQVITQTISIILEMNAIGLPITQTRFAAGNIQRWTWMRNGDGEVLEATNPEGFLTQYQANLLGWPHHINQQRSAGTNPTFDVTEFLYNRRGQMAKLIDPAGQETEYQYEPFGALSNQHSAGQPRVLHSFFYDNLGRVDLEIIGTTQIKHDYDKRGDPVGESYEQSGVWESLSQRTLDDLGRVREASNFNPALNWITIGDRTVKQRFDYDILGRVILDGVQVGLNAPHDLNSSWSLNPQGVWQRDLMYIAAGQNTTWSETFDRVGRMESKARLLPSGATLQTTFQWLGDLYTGRTQEQAGHTSPFREQRQLDAFGLPLHSTYTAIDLDQNQAPLNSTEGIAYCGGDWDLMACSHPLLQVDILRDRMGRIGSLQWRFGHPVRSGGVVSSTHPAPWRGYTYNPMGQLSQSWEQAGVSSVVSTVGLATHALTTVDVQQLGQSANAELWEYQREQVVGDTVSIRNLATGAERWSLPTARGAGHQIQVVAVDGVTQTLGYDTAGRLVAQGTHSYIYDPRGQLAAVLNNGEIIEAYTYDASGRLVAVFTGSQTQPTNVFAYDGEQMVVAFDSSSRPLWQAAWGPGIDQLIEWRDLAGGSGDYIPLIDHRNSVVGAWNVQQSQLTQTAEYNAEGRLTVRSADDQIVCQEPGTGQICPNPGDIPFGFVSAWRSRSSGLVYMRNRWYSPDLNEFVSPDPLGYRDSYNTYTYVANDPVNRLDPWGLGVPKLVSPPEPIVRLVPELAPEATEGVSVATGASEAAGLTAGIALGIAIGLAPSPIADSSLNHSFEPSSPPCSRTCRAEPVAQVDPSQLVCKSCARPPVQVEQPAAASESKKRGKFLRSGANAKEWAKHIKEHPGECYLCGKLLKKGEGQVEHIIPVKEFAALLKEELITREQAREYVNDWRNLLRACWGCNSQKSGTDYVGIRDMFPELNKALDEMEKVIGQHKPSGVPGMVPPVRDSPPKQPDHKSPKSFSD